MWWAACGSHTQLQISSILGVLQIPDLKISMDCFVQPHVVVIISGLRHAELCGDHHQKAPMKSIIIYEDIFYREVHRQFWDCLLV